MKPDEVIGLFKTFALFLDTVGKKKFAMFFVNNVLFVYSKIVYRNLVMLFCPLAYMLTLFISSDLYE